MISPIEKKAGEVLEASPANLHLQLKHKNIISSCHNPSPHGVMVPHRIVTRFVKSMLSDNTFFLKKKARLGPSLTLPRVVEAVHPLKVRYFFHFKAW
jgi:hypothetical protein